MNQKKNNSTNMKRISKWIVGIVALCILIYLCANNIPGILKAISSIVSLFIPLILGVVIALIINVPMRSIEKRLFAKTNKPKLVKLRRPLAIILSELLVFGIFILVALLVVPELINAITILSGNLIKFINTLSQYEATIDFSSLPFGEYINLDQINWQQIESQIESFVKSQSSTVVNTALSTAFSVAGGFINFVVGFVFSIYTLFHKEKLEQQAKRLLCAWLPAGISNYTIHVASVFSKTFRSFISAQTTEALILGSLCALGMMLLRLPYVTMISALVGVTALIPVIGAFIGTIIGAFMILTVDPFQTIVFVIFLLILQQIEGNLIYPKVVGASIRLPAMWVLAAVTIGGSIGGPIGMLIGVPTTSALYTLIREATENREAKLSAENTVEDENSSPETTEDTLSEQ